MRGYDRRFRGELVLLKGSPFGEIGFYAAAYELKCNAK